MYVVAVQLADGRFQDTGYAFRNFKAAHTIYDYYRFKWPTRTYRVMTVGSDYLPAQTVPITY